MSKKEFFFSHFLIKITLKTQNYTYGIQCKKLINLPFPRPFWINVQRVQHHSQTCGPAIRRLCLCRQLLAQRKIIFHIALDHGLQKQFFTLLSGESDEIFGEWALVKGCGGGATTAAARGRRWLLLLGACLLLFLVAAAWRKGSLCECEESGGCFFPVI